MSTTNTKTSDDARLPPEERQRRRVLADFRRIRGKGEPERLPVTPEERAALRFALARAEYDAVMSNAWRTDARRGAAKGSTMAGSVDGVDVKARTAWVVASTPAPIRGERIVSWNLDAFRKNPVILWGHDTTQLPIGTAEDVEETDDGLRVLVRFASAEANPLAEAVLRCADEGVLRAVSVGFATESTVSELPDGTKEIRASLREISFVSVGADEDAGTSAINPNASEGRPARKRKRAATDGKPPYGTAKPPVGVSNTGGDRPYDPWKGEQLDQIADDEGNGSTLAGMPDDEHKALAAMVAEEKRARDVRAASANRRTRKIAGDDPDNGDTVTTFDANEDPVTRARRELEERARNAWRTPKPTGGALAAPPGEDAVTKARREMHERAASASKGGR